MTALHHAASHDDPAAAQLLLDHGADPNLRNSAGFTPLLLAVARGSRAVVELLLEKGANADLQARPSALTETCLLRPEPICAGP